MASDGCIHTLCASRSRAPAVPRAFLWYAHSLGMASLFSNGKTDRGALTRPMAPRVLSYCAWYAGGMRALMAGTSERFVGVERSLGSCVASSSKFWGERGACVGWVRV